MLSICMIVKNEAENIEKCLNSIIGVADEIIIVDTGSTDETKNIIKRFNFKTRLIESNWINDFSYSRNISISVAQYEWIMWMDADDILPYESANIINQLKRLPADRIFRFNIHNMNVADYSIVEKEKFLQPRMFPRNEKLKFKGILHESIVFTAKETGIPETYLSGVTIEHHGYSNREKLYEKLKRNLRLMLIAFGFPPNKKWYEFEEMGMICFYSPNTLVIWDQKRMISAIDPFLDGLPEKPIEREMKIKRRAREEIKKYQDRNVITRLSNVLKRMGTTEITNEPNLVNKNNNQRSGLRIDHARQRN